DVVNTSPWSELSGVPIAVFAAPTYLFVLALLWLGRSRPALLSYAFCIGIATACLSVALFLISKTQIGFLCLWCMRLYGINFAIPILLALGGDGRSTRDRPSPLAHLRRTARDLMSWPRELRLSAVFFVLLLGCTLATEHRYRSVLERRSAEDLQRIM